MVVKPGVTEDVRTVTQFGFVSAFGYAPTVRADVKIGSHRRSGPTPRLWSRRLRIGSFTYIDVGQRRIAFDASLSFGLSRRAHV